MMCNANNNYKETRRKDRQLHRRVWSALKRKVINIGHNQHIIKHHVVNSPHTSVTTRKNNKKKSS